MKQVRIAKQGRLRVYYRSESEKKYKRRYWENFVIDRMRFNRRIQETENQIGHVFDKSHRDMIYVTRFQIQL